MNAREARSEVSRLLAQIDAERDAAYQALYGMAEGMARHNFITARMEMLGVATEELKGVVGEQEALRLVCEHLEDISHNSSKHQST